MSITLTKSTLTTNFAQVEEVMEMLVTGNSARTQSPTEANATSSRSHAVLQINVSQRDRNSAASEPTTMATLSIIDLAGSERASATKNRGERLLEGANINKSLLSLGSCINALCDPRKKNHVPYRNSKLTRLLKFSLGGNCRTVMIVCVSPNSAHFDETQNTLRYANRAKNIQTKVVRNVYNVDRHVKDYLKKIDEQMARINELQAQQKDFESMAFAKFRKQEDKKDAVTKDGLERIRAAYTHSTDERKERINMMKRLRQIERRIAAISAWIGSFDQVCETREDEDPPKSLVAMRKTASGILIELEGSRQHYHQKLAKSNWERAIDTAVQHGLRQIQELDPSATGLSPAIETLTREADSFKGEADREAYTAVLEQEKAGETALLQIMLQAHFETVAILGQIMQMNEDDAVQAAKNVLAKLLTSCTESVAQVIRPDGGLQIVEAVPPTRSGTPKKKRGFQITGPSPMKAKIRPSLLSAPHLRDSSPSEASSTNPPTSAKASPRRRMFGAARKGISVSGTPNRKSGMKINKRVVRWRDDTEDGKLAEFQATPPALDATPQDSLPTVRPDVSFGGNVEQSGDQIDSSPMPLPPVPSSDARKHGSGRFEAGFLSKRSHGSPPPAFNLPSQDHQPLSPMREISGNAAPSQPHLNAIMESHDHMNASGDSSDCSPSAHHNDAIGLGIHESKDAARRLHTAMKAKRVSSGTQLKHRRRSPTAASTASPPHAPGSGMFSAGQARRMVSGQRGGGGGGATGDWTSSVLSPRSQPVLKGAQSLGNLRRTTFDSAGASARAGAGADGGPGSAVRGSLRVSSVMPGGRPGSSAGNSTTHGSGGAGGGGGAKAVWR